jgi:hypothetical protein
VGRPGTSRDVPPESHLSPTLRVFVSPCGNASYDFQKTQSRDVPGTFGKISFLASLDSPPRHQGTKNRYILLQTNTEKIKNSKNIKPFAFETLLDAFGPAFARFCAVSHHRGRRENHLEEQIKQTIRRYCKTQHRDGDLAGTSPAATEDGQGQALQLRNLSLTHAVAALGFATASLDCPPSR